MSDWQCFLMLVQTAALNMEMRFNDMAACQVLAKAMYIPELAIPHLDFAKMAAMANEFVYHVYYGSDIPDWLCDHWFPEEMI